MLTQVDPTIVFRLKSTNFNHNHEPRVGNTEPWKQRTVGT